MVRLSKRAPSARSSAATCLLTALCVERASRATAEKLPLSTTRTKVCMAVSRSMVAPIDSCLECMLVLAAA